MSPELQTTLWGFAAVAPLMLNMITRRGPDARGLSAMIVLIWAWGRLMHAIYTVPECMALYPLVDSIAGATAFTAFMTKKRGWKLLLTAFYLLQVMLALAFWMAWPHPGSLYTYILWNNWAFAGQLLCVAWPGGLSVAHRFKSRLSHRARPLHLPRTGR